MTLLEALEKCREIVGPRRYVNVGVEATSYSGRVKVACTAYVEIDSGSRWLSPEVSTLEEVVKIVQMRYGQVNSAVDVSVGEE